jgi:hypothetical protein
MSFVSQVLSLKKREREKLRAHMYDLGKSLHCLNQTLYESFLTILKSERGKEDAIIKL